MQKKVLITDNVHPLLQEGLEKLGYKCSYQPKIGQKEVLTQIADYEGLVINSKITVDKKFINQARKLKFVARLGSGREIVDINYAEQKKIACFFSPEGNRNAVAEHALGMLLSLANKLTRGDREVRQNIWEREANRGFEVMGKTVGIIGYGHTGRQFAKKLQGLGVKVLAYDKYLTNYTTNEEWVEEASEKEILEKADIISLHLPLTEETTHYINQKWIIQLTKPIVLINTSRGAIVHTVDLINGLKQGQVLGACLDVFENEKPETFTTEEREKFTELHQLDNIILSPHVAGWTIESKERLASVLLKKIRGLHRNNS